MMGDHLQTEAVFFYPLPFLACIFEMLYDLRHAHAVNVESVLAIF